MPDLRPWKASKDIPTQQLGCRQQGRQTQHPIGQAKGKRARQAPEQAQPKGHHQPCKRRHPAIDPRVDQKWRDDPVQICPKIARTYKPASPPTARPALRTRHAPQGPDQPRKSQIPRQKRRLRQCHTGPSRQIEGSRPPAGEPRGQAAAQAHASVGSCAGVAAATPGKRTRKRLIRRGSASTTSNSAPVSWGTISPRAGTRPVRR